MTTINKMKRATLGTALAAALAAGFAATAPSRAIAQPAGAVTPVNDVTLSVGAGRLVRFNGTATGVFVANDDVADVNVNASNQIYIFGKAAGNTTVYATDRAGRVVYSANVRVGQNLGSVGQMLDLAMPEADIQVTPMSGMVLLTGTVAQPTDAAEAERLAQAFLGEGTQVVSRLRTATPQQVMLQVRIAEVNRTFVREVGLNLASVDRTGGFNFGVFRGTRPAAIATDPTTLLPINGLPDFTNLADGRWALEAAGRLFGVDVGAALDLAENNGLVTTLAEPSLTALSGETASFLAGGEFPVPISQSLGTVTIEYKSYGVGLAFTPTVLEDGRISMRVRPEVSELSTEGAIRLNGFDVPALTTRRAETTVELGSGQSFMIGGLLRNAHTNSIDRAPGLGSLPIIGALFRSNRFRRAETELVIIVTPYLVRPVSANQVALPTDGLRTANDAQRLLLGQEWDGRTGEQRPMPRAAQPQTVAPGVDTLGSAAPAPAAPAPAPVEQARRGTALPPPPGSRAAQPGFDLR